MNGCDHGGLVIHGSALDLFSRLGIDFELYITVVPEQTEGQSAT